MNDSGYWRWMMKIIHKIYWRWMIQFIEDEWRWLSIRIFEDDWLKLFIKFIEDDWLSIRFIEDEWSKFIVWWMIVIFHKIHDQAHCEMIDDQDLLCVEIIMVDWWWELLCVGIIMIYDQYQLNWKMRCNNESFCWNFAPEHFDQCVIWLKSTTQIFNEYVQLMRKNDKIFMVDDKTHDTNVSRFIVWQNIYGWYMIDNS